MKLLSQHRRTRVDENPCGHQSARASASVGGIDLAGRVVDLGLVAGLQTLPAARSTGVSRLTAYHLARVHRHIDERLDDPDLSVASLARELGLSTSQLPRIFRKEALTPAQAIWERRLDAAHFSRAFRERFGCTPRQWRQRQE